MSVNEVDVEGPGKMDRFLGDGAFPVNQRDAESGGHVEFQRAEDSHPEGKETPADVEERTVPQTSFSPALLEEGHKPILEQIQSLVGIATRLETKPQDEELRGRLVSGVLDFSRTLEAEGLTVLTEDTIPAAFIPVVDDIERTAPLVVRPAILRGRNLILKGIKCLPKSDSAELSPEGSSGADH